MQACNEKIAFVRFDVRLYEVERQATALVLTSFRHRYRTRKACFLSPLSFLIRTVLNFSILLCLINILLARRNYYSREGKVFSSRGEYVLLGSDGENDWWFQV